MKADKADDPKPDDPKPATPAAAAAPPEPALGSLGQGLSDAASAARGWAAGRPRLLLAVAAAAALSLAGWFRVRADRQDASALWAQLDRTSARDELAQLAEDKPGTVVGRVARLEEARALLGRDGLAVWAGRDPDKRAKGLDNIEKGRDLFAKLADELAGDPTLRAQALWGAADAELTLAGVPKPGGDGFRGSVEAAAEFLRRYAAVVGPATPAAETATRRADDLVASAELVRQVGRAAAARLTPAAPSTDLKPPADLTPPAGPGSPLGGLKPPVGLSPPTAAAPVMSPPIASAPPAPPVSPPPPPAIAPLKPDVTPPAPASRP